jgi:aminopeptidase YwaD
MRNLILLLFVFPFLSWAQVEQARGHVEKLCSPDFHGRGYVKNGDKIAAEYIAGQFAEIGCQSFEPGPFQMFQFQINAFPGRMSFSINDKKLVPGTEFVVDPGSKGGEVTNLQLVDLTPEEVFDAKKLKNRIAQINIEKGGRSKQQLALMFSTWNLKGDSLKQVKKLMREMVTTFPIVEVVDDKFTWSVEQEQFNNPFIQLQLSALKLQVSNTISYDIEAIVKDHSARNVIAYVPAKKKSKKYIVFTAHYDHLGRMGNEAYFPGGNDNASGVAMLIELARYYKANPLDVNVVFIAFAGEEVGLLGSKYFTENPVFPLENIQFLFNTDIMGSGEDGVTIVNATLFPKHFELLQQINTANNYVVKVGSRGPAANSDHYFFTEKGVPAFFMYTMGPNKHYHDVGDTYENLSFAEFNDLFGLLTNFGTQVSGKAYKRSKKK